MGRIWKQILAPGRYRLKNGRIVEYTRRDAQNAAKYGRQQIAAGLRIPLCWEHDPRAEPAYLSDLHANAWLARGYFGDVTDYRFNSDGTLDALVEIPDPNDEKQFRKVGHVSPRVDFDWTDEKGQLWPGLTVGHVAVTPKPVQRQQPREVCPASSFLSNAGPGRSRETHYLSQAIRVGPNMPMEPEPTPEIEGGGDAALIQECMAILEDHGLHLGGDISNWDEFAIALKAAGHTKAGGPPEEEEPEPEGNEPDDGMGVEAGDDPDKGTQPGPMPPAMMSVFANGAKLEVQSLEHRINNLAASGRVDGDTARKMQGQLKRANLSVNDLFDAKGEKKTPDIERLISAYELLPPGRFAKTKGKKADLSQLASASPPSQYVGGNDSGIAEAVKFFSEKAKALSQAK